MDAKFGFDPAENEPSKVSAPKLSVLRQYTESPEPASQLREHLARGQIVDSRPPKEASEKFGSILVTYVTSNSTIVHFTV